jgi:hypothetical protein
MRVVLVNHNTSLYAELALRSLIALNPNDEFDITVVDNKSSDDTAALFSWAHEEGIAVEQSGFTTSEPANTHGEVLRRFVLESPSTEYFLFLDADACFVHSGTVGEMRTRLDGTVTAFAAQAEILLYVSAALGRQPRPREYIQQQDGSRLRLFARPHPFCLLVRDSLQFRLVAEHIGFSNASRSAASEELRGFYDTFGLAGAAMRTHGSGWLVAGGPVLHYAQAAERRDAPDLMQLKDEDCARRLEILRSSWRTW